MTSAAAVMPRDRLGGPAVNSWLVADVAGVMQFPWGAGQDVGNVVVVCKCQTDVWHVWYLQDSSRLVTSHVSLSHQMTTVRLAGRSSAGGGNCYRTIAPFTCRLYTLTTIVFWSECLSQEIIGSGTRSPINWYSYRLLSQRHIDLSILRRLGIVR